MATELGLGNFLYELSVDNGNAHFKFRDPEDATNNAEVSINQKDFPDGVVKPDARQVADLAFFKVSKDLNAKRDERLKRERAEADEAKTQEEARVRETADQHFADSNEPSIQTAKVDKDDKGNETNVYNTENVRAPESNQNEDNKKKK